MPHLPGLTERGAKNRKKGEVRKPRLLLYQWFSTCHHPAASGVPLVLPPQAILR